MRRLIIALLMSAMMMSVITGCVGSKDAAQTENTGASQNAGPIEDGDED